MSNSNRDNQLANFRDLAAGATFFLPSRVGNTGIVRTEYVKVSPRKYRKPNERFEILSRYSKFEVSKAK